MPYVLGIVCYGLHESAAVLIDGGRVIAAAEEERFTRIKFDNGFPSSAISFCLKQAGISGNELAAIGFGFDPKRRLLSKAAYCIRHLPKSLHLLGTRGGMQGQLLRIKREIRSRLGYAGPVYQLNHHLCHASSAFHASPYEAASVLTLDGVGDWEACWMGLGQGNRLQQVAAIDWPLSLGHIYSAFTEYFGFQSFSDEYRVMGLSSYGDPAPHAKIMAEIFQPTPTGYAVDLRYFDFPTGHVPRYGKKLVEAFGPALRGGEEDIAENYRNLAAALQAQLETVVCHLVRMTVKQTGQNKLCLAGGVALNCVANGRLVSEGIVEELYVPPCASDSGAALGAAFLAHIKVLGQLAREPLTTALLGPAYSDAEIEQVLISHDLPRQHITDPAACAAQLLCDGRVIGWVQDRLEFGHRALGARSILADPRRADMKDIINSKVKFREPFRPFAPSVLEERVGEYFHCSRQIPFMTETCRVREEMRGLIPAVIHVDGTARVQTVSKISNPLYWSLITHFDKLTGIPLVLNTSFNVKGQPIVNTPEQAVDTFMKTNIDALVCGRYVVLKSGTTLAPEFWQSAKPGTV